MLRQQLRKHLVHAIRQAPNVVLDFLCRALSSLPTPLSALPFPDLEAALRLIFHFGEGCGGVSGLTSGASGAGGAARRAASPNGAAELLRSGAFPQMVLALHDSDVAQHKHPQVGAWVDGREGGREVLRVCVFLSFFCHFVILSFFFLSFFLSFFCHAFVI